MIGFVFYQENAGSSGKLKSIIPRSSEILLFTLQKSRFSERSRTNEERERIVLKQPDFFGTDLTFIAKP